MLWNGPIPPGLVIDHVCRVKHCVNPAHMEIVSPRDNTIRGNGPSAINSRATHCRHGHEFSESNTYWYRQGRARMCRQCVRAASRRYKDRKRLELDIASGNGVASVGEDSHAEGKQARD